MRNPTMAETQRQKIAALIAEVIWRQVQKTETTTKMTQTKKEAPDES
jgi:hypothetical protein